MTLKPCPNPLCRSKRVYMLEAPYTPRVVCGDCMLNGPMDDTTGEKWNNMLRVEDVEAAYNNGDDDACNEYRTGLSQWTVSETKRDLDRRMGK